MAPLSIDARDAEGRYLREPSHDRTPERLFERAWAWLSWMACWCGCGASTRAQAGGCIDALKVVLTDGPRAVPHAELARQLGTTAGAVQVAIHRLRRRYRDLVREAIAATVDDEAEVEDEIRDLYTALGD